MSSYYYAKGNNTNRFSSNGGSRYSRNGSYTKRNPKTTNIESEMLGEIGTVLDIIKFGTNVEIATLLDTFAYISVFLSMADLIQSLFHKIVNPDDKYSATRAQISKVMSKIVPSRFTYMEPETSEMGKVKREEQSWDRRFSVGKIKNTENENEDVFYFVGNIELPPKVRVLDNIVDFEEIDQTKSQGDMVLQVCKEMSNNVIDLGKRRDELIDSVLPVVNLRGTNDKVIIVNPKQTYAPALIEFLEGNTNTITLNANHQKFNEFAKLERRIARTMGDNNQKLSQLGTNFNKLKMDEIKYDRSSNATAENSIKATIDSFATKALIQEMQMVLKDSNSTSLRDYWDCFMSCSLANIFNPSSAMSRVEDMDLHVQEIKVKAQNEIQKMKQPKDDAIFVRIIKKVTDEFQKLRNTCDSLKECLIMTEEFEVLTYKRLNNTLELITSLGSLYIKKHIQNEVQSILILRGIGKIDDKVGGDSFVEKNKWDATREVLEQIIYDTTSVSNGTNNREGSNNNDKVLFTKRGSPNRKTSKTKNSNLPEISRGDLKQLLQNIRNTLKIGKLTSAKKYKDKITHDAVISNVEVVCGNNQQSLPRLWCHYCGDNHMMRKCEEK